ncbi:Glycosyltransferase involved in cell wall bisynthesis [Neorhodopirellula lusitana]|uniref:Glycosyltransferase involved in cell wall bisynthesis n=1 Tax=Neorhodopirellula lusitana TaxID=445327 RepID=A0ABY1QDR4_9BACT|nr:glycosyltransferase family 4 protein [Neorhodopirellula lusitana]SMP68509.1 Glycosyltransferase involved in cell wall bisynthesis [Neorhodopirellula lusitana]
MTLTSNRRPPRILMLLENESMPDDNRVLLEAKSLIESGYQVTVVCPTGQESAKHVVIDGIRIYRYPSTFEPNGFLGYLWEYGYSLTMMFVISLYVLVRRGFDVVHVHTPPDMTALIAIFYQCLGKKFVFDLHDLSPELYLARGGKTEPNLVYHVLRFFERLACRCANRLIATNETQRSVQIDRCGAKPEHCYVVRNGPNESFLNDVQPLPEFQTPGKLVLGYVGVIGIQDGVDYMIRTIEILKNKHGRDDFQVIIVGGGPAAADLMTLAEELGVADLIHLTGLIPFTSVPRYIASFDICFTPDPSNDYNDSCTTIKTMEYMALRKPTVCFRTRENVLTAGDSALYADNNDVDDLAKVTLRLMDDPELRKSLGELARENVEDGLTWAHQAPRLIACYDDLFNMPPRTSTSPGTGDAAVPDENPETIGV